MRRQAKKFAKGSPSDGSALILTVVLTSLLAMVGVLFVMMARVNQIATSGISESRELDSAIETVIAKISEELALDIPRKGPNDIELSEYYDYPGLKDKWLASLEPHQDGTVYKWRQISDVTGYLEYKVFGRQDVDVELPLAQRPKPSESWVRDYPQINVDEDGDFLDKDGALATEGLWADADGDGVADSKWIELDDITSSKGKPIYAAIRIVDNGGMLNVNTAYKFDPNEPLGRIDGSSQMQINLMGLSERDQTHTPQQKIDRLWSFRAGLAPNDISSYEQNVVWQYGNPTGGYIPFDVSDEMKLRNRYILNYNLMTSRIEKLWTNAYDVGPRVPLPTTNYPFNRWPNCTILGTAEPNDYDYRHISTTYNMDRIIRPDGGRMLNINHDDPNVNVIYNAIRAGLIDGGITDPNSPAAQITVNLIDFRDKDVNDNVTTITVDGTTYYGFERPCVYISELAHKFLVTEAGGGPVGSDTWRSYAVELYKPYTVDDYPEPNNWRLFIDNSAASPPGDKIEPVNWSGTSQFHVIKWENTYTELDVDPNASPQDINNLYNKVFDNGSIISLQRNVNGIWISVDSTQVPGPAGGWLVAMDGTAFSVQRNITPHKCIRRLWANPSSSLMLGGYNNVPDGDSIYIQAHPYLDPLIYPERGFRNIGEIGMLFREDVYSRTWDSADTEADVRLDLTKPEFRQLFNYLTVWPPSEYVFDPNEVRVKGRININTAPWYVIAQLPWMQYEDSNVAPMAKAITDKRDELLQQGFWNIGELMLVDEMQSLGEDGLDQVGFPDLTTPSGSSGDGAVDDFEERDLIFARISNLVTVRSDVFTAYILVRIGTDGPQKRVIAILDRSDVYLPTDRVKIVAVHPVADPR